MELEQIRTKINAVNKEMLRLFEERMQLCGQVAEYKRTHHMDIFVPAREVEILEWVKANAQEKFSSYDLEFFNELLRLGRSYQQSVLGEQAASSVPPVKTDRLLLLPLSPQDAEPVFSLTANPDVAKYMRFDTHETVEETQRLIDGYCKPGNLPYKVLLAQTGEFIGVFVLKISDDIPAAADISLFLAPDSWNQGYAFELLSVAQDIAPRFMRVNRLLAYVVAEHAASCHVLEKAGFRLLKTLTLDDEESVLQVYELPLSAYH